MNMRDAALNYCGRIKDRLIVLPSDRPVSVSEIKTGVLFVWATWSVPAKLALEALCEALSSSAGFEKIFLYIADNDADTTEQFMASTRQTPAGLGETFWISNGKILARLGDYTSKQRDVLVQYNRKLLSSH
jgi:hypothetical protein